MFQEDVHLVEDVQVFVRNSRFGGHRRLDRLSISAESVFIHPELQTSQVNISYNLVNIRK